MLHLVEDYHRFAGSKPRVVVILELKKQTVQIRDVLKQVPHLLGCLREVYQNIRLILPLGKLFRQGRFAYTSGTFYQKCGLSIALLFP